MPAASRRLRIAARPAASRATIVKWRRPGGAGGRLRRALSLPDVQRHPVREAAAGVEVGHAEQQEGVLLEAELVAVEGVGGVEVADVEVDVADLGARRERLVEVGVLLEVGEDRVGVERLDRPAQAPLGVDDAELRPAAPTSR